MDEIAARVCVQPGGRVPVICLSQFDSGARTIRFDLYDSDDGRFRIPSGTEARIEGRKKDRNGFSYNSSTHTDVITVSDTYVTVTVQEQMTAVVGPVVCELVLTNDIGRIGSGNFVFKIEESPLDADTTMENSGIPSVIVSQDGKTFYIREDVKETLVAQIEKNATDINRLNAILGVDVTNLIPHSRAFDLGEGDSVLTGEEYEGLSVRYLDNTEAESGNVEFIRITFDSTPTEQGKPYTFSFFAKGTPSDEKLRVILGFSFGSYVTSQGDTGSGANLGSYFALSEDWVRHWMTVTPDEDDELEYILIRVYYGAEAYVCGLQLQNGDTATPWIAAAEDGENAITLLDSKVQQNAADIEQLSQGMADKMNALPLSVVDGKLCITYIMEE